nr:dynein light chain [Hymenolepis microstoma]
MRRLKTAAAQEMEASKAIIKNSDMSEQMQQKAVDYTKQGIDQYGIEKEVASHIKKAFDRDYGPTWHCVVGRNFGSYVTHEANRFIYFYLKSTAVVLYKSG